MGDLSGIRVREHKYIHLSVYERIVSARSEDRRLRKASSLAAAKKLRKKIMNNVVVPSR